MSFRLMYQYGEQRRNMTESFETEAEAVAKACELITQGDARYLNIENEHGFVILSEAQIRTRGIRDTRRGSHEP
jgi:hypothetical protein